MVNEALPGQMTVAQMIEQLSKMDPNALVTLNDGPSVVLARLENRGATVLVRPDGEAEIRLDVDATRRLHEAIDDLWGHCPADELEMLDPDTVIVARNVHMLLWHAEKANGDTD